MKIKCVDCKTIFRIAERKRSGLFCCCPICGKAQGIEANIYKPLQVNT